MNRTTALSNNRYAAASLSLLLLGMTVWTATASAELISVANPSVPVDAVSKAELKKIFLGQKVKWENGSHVILVTVANEPMHDRFVKSVTGKSENQFRRWWLTKVFTGEGMLPRTFSDAEQARRYIAETPGAIGYVAGGKDDLSLKELQVLDREQG